MRRLLVVAASLVVAVSVIGAVPAAAEADVPTLSPGSPTYAWEGPSTFASNVAYSATRQCGNSQVDFCHPTLLRVDIESSFWDTATGGIEIQISSASSLADFDLYVYKSDANGNRGDPVGVSARNPSAENELVAIPKPSGYYLVEVVYFGMLEQAHYRGLATFLPTPVLAAAAEALGLSCSPVGSPDDPPVEYTSCSGYMSSFDDHPLFTNISIPDDATGPLPTLLMLHGWSGGGGQYRSDGIDGCFTLPDGTCHYEPGIDHFNRTWFVSKGYAVITYSARGHGSSCGFDQDPPAPPERCVKGWAHAAERSFETRDSQHLLSLAVDAEIADATRLAATGASYGGGQTWLLATSLPWTTPNGHTLQLAAAVPWYGWTNLQGSLVPNGRATDAVDQSASHESPYGMFKATWMDALMGRPRAGGVRVGCVVVCPHSQVRMNDLDPAELHSYINGWLAFWHAGEPYDTPVGEALAAAFRGKSAYYADDYLDAVRTASVRTGSVRAVPIFAVSGWADTLFPVVETLQMYRKLKAAHPGYPISMAFADTGHANAQNTVGELRYLNDQATAFLDAHVLRPGAAVGASTVSSFVTRCPASEAETPEASAVSWDQLQAGVVVMRKEGDPRVTTSAPTNAAEETPTDPIIAVTLETPCIKQAPGAYDPERAWSWTVDGSGFTLLGLPTVAVDYRLTGTDATIAAKLWDVAPGGDRTLVTRGVYRLATLAADAPEGRITFQLFGNHWEFAQGHTIQLELSQTDAPFLRPDSLPSAITFSSLELRLPTARMAPGAARMSTRAGGIAEPEQSDRE